MSEPHVLTGLVDKYREISGRLSELERHRAEMKKQLRTINHAIRLYRSNFDVSGIRPKRQYKQNPYFARGQFYRVVMDILREATGPLSTRELAIMALQRQGIEPDSDMADSFRRTLNPALVKYAKAGRIKVNDRVFPKRWELAR